MNAYSSVERTIRAQQAIEGDGFVVRRPFPTMTLSHLDPFLLFDHMGPVDFEPGKGVGTPWHPHRGFETVTYVLDGHLEHRDSMGNHGFLEPGDTQWMTAGSGVLHKEGPSSAAQRNGGRVHGLQLWVNLPAAEKMRSPRYQDLRADAVARRSTDGAIVRVIAGRLFELDGPGATFTPISYAHVTLHEGATVQTAVPDGHCVLAYPMVGSFRSAGTHIDEGLMAVYADGVDRSVELVGASTTPAEIIVLTGEPIGEPVARYGPFVMNTEAELRQAFADFERGRFGVPAD
jgi:redox-sensitive bicupin YhaK (pirin superfamily)